MLRRIVIPAVLAALTAAALTVVVPTGPAAAGSAADRSRPLRLHATHGKHARIVDAHGAQVLLRGVNVNQLGEYFQANPELETTIPLTESDFRDIARLGFNTVRLIVSWSRLEPTRGSYDTAYAAQLRQAVRWAGDHGLHVVLDMHQDAYGVAVDTPIGTTCPNRTHPNNGWDGAPAWATITDDATTCTSGERELAPAVMHAWQHFYDDTDGIQAELVRTWGRLAEDFARSRTVAGFDLLNEPGFGTDSITNITTQLGAFYRKAIKAIRAGERAGGGFSHLVFFEPSVLWSAGVSRSVPPAGFTKDRNLVFAPHIYSESLSSESIASGFAVAAGAASTYGVPLWSGEWGFFPATPQDAADKIERYAAAEDAAASTGVAGGAWWSWKQACGDPHVVHQPGGEPDAVSPSLVRYACPEQIASAVDPAFGEVLSRPAPRAVPGRITRLRSDGRAGTLVLRGVRGGADRCGLEVFVPARFADARVRVDGITRLRTHHDHGNTVLTGCVSAKFRLRVG